jgi:cold shock CspA family protein
MAPTEENKEVAPKAKKSAKQRLLEQVTSLSSDDDDRQAASKKISWILRHGTRKVNLKPDDDGFVKVADLLKVEILDELSKEKLLSVIAESNAQKPRYHLKDGPDGQLIAALSKDARRAAKGEAGTRAGAPAATGGDVVGKKSSVKEGERASMRGDAPVFIPSGMPSPNPYAQAYSGGYGYPYGAPMMSPMASMSYGGYPSFGMTMSQKGLEPGRYRGKIKSFNTEKGFGFIDCAQAHAQYGRDVFLHKAHVGDMAVGTEVTFVVEMNKQGMPQARDLVTVSSSGKADGKGSKGKGKDAKGKGEKGKSKDSKDRGAEGGKKKEGKGKKKKDGEKKAEGEPEPAPAPPAEAPKPEA